MSTLPNATNAAPGTSYFGSGGGGSIGGDITVSSLTIKNNIGSFFEGAGGVCTYYGTSGLRIGDSNDYYAGWLLNAGQFLVQQNATGTSAPVITCDVTQGSATFPGCALTSISSINTKAPVVGDSGNRGPMLIQNGECPVVSSGSTIVTFNTAYATSTYTVCLTQSSGQPVVTPWIRERLPTGFTASGDEGAIFDWIAVGV